MLRCRCRGNDRKELWNGKTRNSESEKTLRLAIQGENDVGTDAIVFGEDIRRKPRRGRTKDKFFSWYDDGKKWLAKVAFSFCA